jgi:hypothetical protein
MGHGIGQLPPFFLFVKILSTHHLAKSLTLGVAVGATSLSMLASLSLFLNFPFENANRAKKEEKGKRDGERPRLRCGRDVECLEALAHQSYGVVAANYRSHNHRRMLHNVLFMLKRNDITETQCNTLPRLQGQ